MSVRVVGSWLMSLSVCVYWVRVSVGVHVVPFSWLFVRLVVRVCVWFGSLFVCDCVGVCFCELVCVVLCCAV